MADREAVATLDWAKNAGPERSISRVDATHVASDDILAAEHWRIRNSTLALLKLSGAQSEFDLSMRRDS
jgi:hypothetical protein